MSSNSAELLENLFFFFFQVLNLQKEDLLSKDNISVLAIDTEIHVERDP